MTRWRAVDEVMAAARLEKQTLCPRGCDTVVTPLQFRSISARWLGNAQLPRRRSTRPLFVPRRRTAKRMSRQVKWPKPPTTNPEN